MHAVLRIVVNNSIHLHPSHGELDVLLVLLEVFKDGLLIEFRKTVSNFLGLLLCFGRAVNGGANKTLISFMQVGKAILNIGIVALHD